jgi:hypothetical protein
MLLCINNRIYQIYKYNERPIERPKDGRIDRIKLRKSSTICFILTQPERKQIIERGRYLRPLSSTKSTNSTIM